MDRDLVKQAQRGDREAFTVLVHQGSDSLYAVGYRILRDTGLAEDALQNALVLAWRRLPKLRDPDRFEAWIHRILVHACYDESQRTRSWRTSVTALPINLPGTLDTTSSIADRDELERAFRHLTVEQRAVFVLHHYLGLPSWRSLSSSASPRARPDRDCITPSPGFARPSWPKSSPPFGKDVSHDRRSIARTRRSIVARRGADTRPRPRRRGGLCPHPDDTTGMGPPGPVEVADHESHGPPRRHRRHRRGCDRRLAVPARSRRLGRRVGARHRATPPLQRP